MPGEPDSNDAPSTRRRAVLKSIAGAAAVGIPSMTESAAAQSSLPTVRLQGCKVFDEESYNFKQINPKNKENPAGDISGNLITAGTQTTSLTDSRKIIFLHLGTWFKVTNSQPSNSVNISFNGRYKGLLKALGSGVARFKINGHLSEPGSGSVAGTYIFEEVQRVPDNDEFVEQEVDDNFGGALSATLKNNSTYQVFLEAELEVRTLQAPGRATADFGPQIDGQTSPPQGITLRNIVLNFA